MRRAEKRSKQNQGGSCKNVRVLHPPVSKVTPGKPSPPPAITGTQRTTPEGLRARLVSISARRKPSTSRELVLDRPSPPQGVGSCPGRGTTLRAPGRGPLSICSGKIGQSRPHILKKGKKPDDPTPQAPHFAKESLAMSVHSLGVVETYLPIYLKIIRNDISMSVSTRYIDTIHRNAEPSGWLRTPTDPSGPRPHGGRKT